MVVPAQTHLLRQMMSADVDGGFAAFFADPPPLDAAAAGLAALSGAACAAACALFLLRAMSPLRQWQHWR